MLTLLRSLKTPGARVNSCSLSLPIVISDYLSKSQECEQLRERLAEVQGEGNQLRVELQQVRADKALMHEEIQRMHKEIGLYKEEAGRARDQAD